MQFITGIMLQRLSSLCFADLERERESECDEGEGEGVSVVKKGRGRCTIVGHSEDGNLSDGAVASLHTPGSLVDGGQIGVHVARETTPTGHLLSGC